MNALIGLLVVVFALTATAVRAEIKVTEQVVGPSAEGGGYIISPSGGRVAYTGTKGSRLVVLIDGIEGPVFDELFNPHGDSYFTPARPKYAAFTANPGGRTNAAAQPAPVIWSRSVPARDRSHRGSILTANWWLPRAGRSTI